MLYVPMDCSLPSSSVHGILPWLDSPMDRFSRPEYWSGLLFPSLRDLSDPGIEPMSPELQADSPGKWNKWVVLPEIRRQKLQLSLKGISENSSKSNTEKILIFPA